MSLDRDSIRNRYKTVEEFLRGEKNKHICECGCNEEIEIKTSHYWNGIPRFIFGHAARLRTGPIAYDRSKYYSVSDIAKKGNVSHQTVRLWNRKGKIGSVMLTGRKKLFLKDEVDKFLRSRSKRKTYDRGKYISFSDLKKMGISRKKLRIKVREGKISEPRHFDRKTNYLREEIERYRAEIMEDPDVKEKRFYFTRNAFIRLKKKVEELERRIRVLEGM